MAVKTYVPKSLEFWTCYLVHMRPYLWFVSGMAGLAGVSISLNTLNMKFALSLIPFFLSYGFGQALTDSFQIDTDKISSPYRPLSQGLISKSDLIAVSITGLVFCGAILVYLSRVNLVFVLVSIFGLWTYSYSKKRYWFFGPPHNSIIVSLLPVMGYFGFADSSGSTLEISQLWPVLCLIFLSYNVFVLMGYLKDISADRRSGYRTFPVIWGWNATVLVSDLLYLICFYIVIRNGWIHDLNWVFITLALLVAISGQVKAHIQKTKNEDHAFFSIIQSVRSFLLMCYIVIYHHQPGTFWYLILCHTLFEVTMCNRPEEKQI